MVFVDFGNPYLRHYLSGYCEAHQRHLDKIRARLPDWVAKARRNEAAAAGEEKRAARPLAAVLDIDEVVLSNIHMNVFAAPAGFQGPTAIDFHACDYFRAPNGKPWPRDDLRLNPLLPGARELLEALRDQNVSIRFITGRLESIRAETAENFVFVGLAGAPKDKAGGGDARRGAVKDAAAKGAQGGPLFSFEEISRPDGPLIMCPDAEYPPAGQTVRPYKESRRRAIEATHRIVVNIGDQISDLGLYGDVQIHTPHPFYWTP